MKAAFSYSYYSYSIESQFQHCYYKEILAFILSYVLKIKLSIFFLVVELGAVPSSDNKTIGALVSSLLLNILLQLHSERDFYVAVNLGTNDVTMTFAFVYLHKKTLSHQGTGTGFQVIELLM